MQKYNTLDDVIALATFAHRNQTDKAGMPYIEHPLRVMKNVQAQGAMPYVQMAAVLHDVTEDTSFTPQMLLELGVPEAAVEVVRLVDRENSRTRYLNCHTIPDTIQAKPRERTQEEINAYYYRNIRQNPAALQVKLADIGDNLQPWRLSYLPAEKQEYLRDKYAKAINLLTGE